MLPSQVIYVGLDIVTPLISLDLLKYPKLSRDVSPFEFSPLVFVIEDNSNQMLIFSLVSLQYFVLMSHLLEVYPEKVAHLNRDAFTRIIGSLDFGLRNQACALSKSALTLFCSVFFFFFFFGVCVCVFDKLIFG
jgi:hypothetical protein